MRENLKKTSIYKEVNKTGKAYPFVNKKCLKQSFQYKTIIAEDHHKHKNLQYVKERSFNLFLETTKNRR